ncbi:GTPase Ria1 [Schizosaccharomyces cryophilus OY26]|uniref:Ribosome assembly protein 1 n=1 Tax=Schizosaccharomyces cryophilus (strain OY26 / ATCC MYA-4695 / CBS 11777 / NBRC 106824 / NRRL Y48691) TaxID=653667 RepID=S9VVB6_SCHCR|nr:GTPase Ria1 [Schizosaccharomyces cryophilus OY26]EPY50025.1 GTPase Ria1 [Schizosaccharomyces cryophilus OY26]
MPVIPPEQLAPLQSNQNNIRNFTLLAHVDHGKTTLADSLLATNGIISSKLAGTVRYLDFREDEITRGITMKSSAISLFFKIISEHRERAVEKDYLINLIDSPGHVDFSSEVSSASRLCDGAFILIDAVEGVCSQTITVLRQAWVDRIKMILVINKMDRLVTELKLSPIEAHYHLLRLIEQVNAVIGTFYRGELMNLDETEEETSDEGIYFSPEQGNVIFASAYDGWAFFLDQFSDFYEKKLGLKSSVLTKCLWGDYYLDPKTKRILQAKHLQGRRLKPLFVQFVLDNIWAVYNSAVVDRDLDKIEKIVKTLNIKVLPRDMKSKDPRNLLLAVFQQWLPLSTAILLTAIRKIPCPIDAQKDRALKVLKTTPHFENVDQNIATAMSNCNANKEEPMLAYISKMVAFSERDLPNQKRRQLTAEQMRELRQAKLAGSLEDSVGVLSINENEESNEAEENSENRYVNEEEEKDVFVGFARIYSGSISVGQQIYVYGPKYDPAKPDEHITKVTIESLYLMMGQELFALDTVPAGNVFAIGGLAGTVLRTATLCSVPGGPNLVGVTQQADPIVRVAVEPMRPYEMSKLVAGLEMLNQADPCVQIAAEENGEHVIMCAGEIHLERCLKDLRERFAKIEIQSSQPIVPFRETTVADPDMTAKDKDTPIGFVSTSLASGGVKIGISVTPLSSDLVNFLLNHEHTIELFMHHITKKTRNGDISFADLQKQKEEILSSEDFITSIHDLLAKDASDKSNLNEYLDSIMSFGPRRVGPNILIDKTGLMKKARHESDGSRLIAFDLAEYIITAFQISTQQGPLCAEPVQGICVSVDSIEIGDNGEENESLTVNNPQIPGQVISTVREAVKQGFLAWSPRLLLAMYSCDIQATAEVLGRVYGVVAKRRGRIVDEEMKEGTPFFNVKAVIPVVESFGFAVEILKRTSGAAYPQLIFHGFEMLDENPFWVPTTEEELEDLGELADRENIAKRYMLDVRRRKGLLVEQKVIEKAEKQRTLKH